MRKAVVASLLLVLTIGCSEGPIPTKQDASTDNSSAEIAVDQPAPPAHSSAAPKAKAVSAEPKAEATAKPKGPLGWSPDPELADQLAFGDTDHIVRKYTLRPPKGWDYFFYNGHSTRDGTTQFGAWRTTVPGDHVALELMMAVDRRKKPVTDSLEDICAAYEGSVRKGMANFNKEPTERGSIGGLDFIRYRWTGSREGQHIKGAFYLARDGDRLIYFVLVSPGEKNEQNLRLMESAVLTLKKAG